jgi:hypothetical protein
MTDIDSIRGRLHDMSMLTPISANDTEALKVEFVGIPIEYTEFLEKVGYGEVGDIRIYEAPTSPDDIYPVAQGDLSGIVLFGDDFQGYCFGFDTTKNFCLVEVDPRGNPRPRSEKGFLSLIAGYIPE